MEELRVADEFNETHNRPGLEFRQGCMLVIPSRADRDRDLGGAPDPR